MPQATNCQGEVGLGLGPIFHFAITLRSEHFGPFMSIAMAQDFCDIDMMMFHGRRADMESTWKEPTFPDGKQAPQYCDLSAGTNPKTVHPAPKPATVNPEP